MNFDIKTLFELIQQDEFYNNKPEHEPEEETDLLDATEEAIIDAKIYENIESLYIHCKNKLLELGFIDGFRTAVALILDNGKGGVKEAAHDK